MVYDKNTFVFPCPSPAYSAHCTSRRIFADSTWGKIPRRIHTVSGVSAFHRKEGPVSLPHPAPDLYTSRIANDCQTRRKLPGQSEIRESRNISPLVALSNSLIEGEAENPPPRDTSHTKRNGDQYFGPRPTGCYEKGPVSRPLRR